MAENTEAGVPLYVAAEGWSGYAEDILDHWLETGCVGSHNESHLASMVAEEFQDLAVRGCDGG